MNKFAGINNLSELLKIANDSEITYDTDGQGGMDLTHENTTNEINNTPEVTAVAQEVMDIANRYRMAEDADENIIMILEDAASKIHDIIYNKLYEQRASI